MHADPRFLLRMYARAHTGHASIFMRTKYACVYCVRVFLQLLSSRCLCAAAFVQDGIGITDEPLFKV